MIPETKLPGPAGPVSAEVPAFDESNNGIVATRFDRAITASSSIVAWLIFVAMAVSVYEVFMRYGLNSPTSWVHETTVFLIAAIFALGGPVALARNRHIRVRIIYDAVPPSVRRWLDVVNGLLTLLFAAGMTYAAWLMFYPATHNPLGEWQLERSGTSWNPPFPAFVKGLILLALALMAVQAVLHTIQALRGRPVPAARPDGR